MPLGYPQKRRAQLQYKSADLMVIGVSGLIGSSVLRSAAEVSWEQRTRMRHFTFPRFVVIGMDEFQPFQGNGSSHGELSITRESIPEEDYVGLVKRSHEIWKALEVNTCERYGKLMHLQDDLIDKPKQNANATADVEDQIGFIRPEACINANLHSSKKGATILNNAKFLGYKKLPNGNVAVLTSVNGAKQTYETKKLIIAAGAPPKQHFAAGFMVDTNKKVSYVSVCSERDAKYAAALGESMAHLALLGESKIDVIKLGEPKATVQITSKL